MAELKKERKGIDWSKIDFNDMIIDDWGRKPVQGYIPKDPMAGERLLQQIKEEELDREKAKERAKEFSSFKNAKNLFDKLTANPIIIGIVLVAGYFAYKKFKK